MMEQATSLLIGFVLLLISGLVIKLYFSLGARVVDHRYRHHPEVWFAHGILTAFTSTWLNTAYFKFYLRMARYGWYSMPSVQVGDYVNYITIIVMIWAAFCHLYSAYLNLPDDDKNAWSWLTVAFYPKMNLIVKLIHRVMGVKGEKR